MPCVPVFGLLLEFPTAVKPLKSLKTQIYDRFLFIIKYNHNFASPFMTLITKLRFMTKRKFKKPGFTRLLRKSIERAR